MTREEQKASDAKKYYPNDINCYDAFLHGVNWADEHPNLEHLWHDANEKPHAKEWLLVQLDKDDYKILCLKDLYIDLWCDWCKIFNFIRWAYIEDLLPKGGKSYDS